VVIAYTAFNVLAVELFSDSLIAPEPEPNALLMPETDARLQEKVAPLAELVGV
jgi:hypothetical protein